MRGSITKVIIAAMLFLAIATLASESEDDNRAAELEE